MNIWIFMQVSIIFRQLEGMTMQSQITCAIRREQMKKGMACRTNLYKQFIVRTVNEIIDGINTVYVTKSSEAR